MVNPTAMGGRSAGVGPATQTLHILLFRCDRPPLAPIVVKPNPGVTTRVIGDAWLPVEAVSTHALILLVAPLLTLGTAKPFSYTCVFSICSLLQPQPRKRSPPKWTPLPNPMFSFKDHRQFRMRNPKMKRQKWSFKRGTKWVYWSRRQKRSKQRKLGWFLSP